VDNIFHFLLGVVVKSLVKGLDKTSLEKKRSGKSQGKKKALSLILSDIRQTLAFV